MLVEALPKLVSSLCYIPAGAQVQQAFVEIMCMIITLMHPSVDLLHEDSLAYTRHGQGVLFLLK